MFLSRPCSRARNWRQKPYLKINKKMIIKYIALILYKLKIKIQDVALTIEPTEVKNNHAYVTSQMI